MLTAFRRADDDATKRILRHRNELLSSPISEAARQRIGHATPGRDCPACPAGRGEHDGWGCARTGCPLPIHSLALTPARRTPMTHTRTHTHQTFANPYLVCDKCGQWVPAWHNRDRCGCDDDQSWRNLPCDHTAGVTSACPSWGPVDGCQCSPCDHPVPPAVVTGDRRA